MSQIDETETVLRALIRQAVKNVAQAELDAVIVTDQETLNYMEETKR